MAKKKIAEAPAVVLPTPEAAVEAAEEAGTILPTGKCSDCGLPVTTCLNLHVERVLTQKVILNGVKFGPGKCVTPKNADIFDAVSVKE